MNYMLREENGVRRFNDASIQKAIDEALAHVSADKPVAVVGHATPFGKRISIAARLGDDWTIMAAAYRERRATDKWDASVEAKVIWTPDIKW